MHNTHTLTHTQHKHNFCTFPKSKDVYISDLGEYLFTQYPINIVRVHTHTSRQKLLLVITTL